MRFGVSACSSWACVSIVGAGCSETTLTLPEAELGRLRNAKDVITRAVMTIMEMVCKFMISKHIPGEQSVEVPQWPGISHCVLQLRAGIYLV